MKPLTINVSSVRVCFEFLVQLIVLLTTEPSDGVIAHGHVTTGGQSLNDGYASAELGTHAHGKYLVVIECFGIFNQVINLEELQDFDADAWDDELDGEGDPDTTWVEENDIRDGSISNENSITPSNKVSKRSFDDFGLEYSDDDYVSESPGLFYPSSLAAQF